MCRVAQEGFPDFAYALLQTGRMTSSSMLFTRALMTNEKLLILGFGISEAVTLVMVSLLFTCNTPRRERATSHNYFLIASLMLQTLSSVSGLSWYFRNRDTNLSPYPSQFSSPIAQQDRAWLELGMASLILSSIANRVFCSADTDDGPEKPVRSVLTSMVAAIRNIIPWALIGAAIFGGDGYPLMWYANHLFLFFAGTYLAPAMLCMLIAVCNPSLAVGVLAFFGVIAEILVPGLPSLISYGLSKCVPAEGIEALVENLPVKENIVATALVAAVPIAMIIIMNIILRDPIDAQSGAIVVGLYCAFFGFQNLQVWSGLLEPRGNDVIARAIQSGSGGDTTTPAIQSRSDTAIDRSIDRAIQRGNDDTRAQGIEMARRR